MDGDILSDSAALLGGSDISQDDPIIYYGPLSLTTAQKVSEKSSRFLTYNIFGRARASASHELYAWAMYLYSTFCTVLILTAT